MWVNRLYLCKKSPIFSVFLVAIVMLSSCNSSLSDGKVADLSVICAKIEIYQNLSDRKDNRVTVSLYDDNNNKIDNKNISIRVNGLLLDTVKTTRLYYFTSNSSIFSPSIEALNLLPALTGPTPEGVPVKIRSPVFSVKYLDTKAMM